MKPSRTIMVVDDEPPIVDFMTEALTDEGYVVYSASDGDSAMSTVIAQNPDLILCDLHMPGITGPSFVERIRQYGLGDIPVIMMTADLHAAKRLADEGFATCLIKPFDLNELFDCVSTHIRAGLKRNPVE